jgi:hypothetical protein
MDGTEGVAATGAATAAALAAALDELASEVELFFAAFFAVNSKPLSFDLEEAFVLPLEMRQQAEHLISPTHPHRVHLLLFMSLCVHRLRFRGSGWSGSG